MDGVSNQMHMIDLVNTYGIDQLAFCIGTTIDVRSRHYRTVRGAHCMYLELVDINLEEGSGSRVLLGAHREHRGHHLARAAPGGHEVNDHLMIDRIVGAWCETCMHALLDDRFTN